MMRKTLAAFFAILLLVPGCSLKKPDTQTIFALNTVVSLTAYGTHGKAGLDAATDIIEHYEQLFSVTIAGSDVCRINVGAGGTVAVDADTAALISSALALCERTDGCLDITIYPVVRAWGFTASDEEKRVPEPDKLSHLLQGVDYRRVAVSDTAVTVPEGAELDLGAVAKGFISDKMIDTMRGTGVTSAIINLGGNVRTLGVKPDGSEWRVAVRNPLMPDEYLGITNIGEGAVVTSGGYERFFTQDGASYHHIINPATGYPADSGLISVTVVAEGGASGLYADALSTALYVLGKDAALALWRDCGGEIDGVRFGLILVSDAGEVTVTPGTNFVQLES